ncbi:hypothetical protein TNCV_1426401 [Trichonephila clavipes]|nr:hypothetical protein TNCV_1426401 [Trichonephila clavipes]
MSSCVAEISRGRRQLRCHPRHLTMVQDHETKLKRLEEYARRKRNEDEVKFRSKGTSASEEISISLPEKRMGHAIVENCHLVPQQLVLQE